MFLNKWKYYISGCKKSNALEINILFPVVFHAIILGKAYLNKLETWPFVIKLIPREI